MLVDSVVGNTILNFIDENLGYNQIFIIENDVSKTTFRCPRLLRIYEWVMIPFGLKNAGAIYQKVMNSIFYSMIG